MTDIAPDTLIVTIAFFVWLVLLIETLLPCAFGSREGPLYRALVAAGATALLASILFQSALMRNTNRDTHLRKADQPCIHRPGNTIAC